MLRRHLGHWVAPPPSNWGSLFESEVWHSLYYWVRHHGARHRDAQNYAPWWWVAEATKEISWLDWWQDGFYDGSQVCLTYLISTNFWSLFIERIVISGSLISLYFISRRLVASATTTHRSRAAISLYRHFSLIFARYFSSIINIDEMPRSKLRMISLRLFFLMMLPPSHDAYLFESWHADIIGSLWAFHYFMIKSF